MLRLAKKRRKKNSLQENDEQSGFILPDELLITIFSLLRVKDMFAVALVCRQWLAVTQDNRLWCHFFNRDIAEAKYQSDSLYTDLYAHTFSRMGRVFAAANSEEVIHSCFTHSALSIGDHIVTITFLVDQSRQINCFLEFRQNELYYIARIFFSSAQTLKGEYINLEEAAEYTKQQLGAVTFEYFIRAAEIMAVFEDWLNRGLPAEYETLEPMALIERLLLASCTETRQLHTMTVRNFVLAFEEKLEKLEVETTSRLSKRHRRCNVS